MLHIFKHQHHLYTSWYRDILFYLQQKAEPRVRRLTSQDELLPYISQFERGELQAIGCFSIVVGAFTRPEQSDSYHVCTHLVALCMYLYLSY